MSSLLNADVSGESQKSKSYSKSALVSMLFLSNLAHDHIQSHNVQVQDHIGLHDMPAH